MASPYTRPPIVEAVIELRFATEVEQETLAKLQKQLYDYYPAPPQNEFQIEVQVGESTDTARTKQTLSGIKLTSDDGADVVIIGPFRLTNARLPPYEGWDRFVETARRNWEIWKRAVGRRRPLGRIGVRFINRIDIPNPTDGPIMLEEYLTVSPRFPTGTLPPMNNFAVNMQFPLAAGDLKLILNVGSIPSPLVKMTSFLLDLDVSIEQNLPSTDEAIWARINEIRAQK